MHRICLLLSIYVVIYGCKPKVEEKEEYQYQKPNIVLILSDDQAWTDYGFMGHEVVQTPNLDKLAKESILFPHGYVTTAVCRPSLMTLSTGLYPHQHRITGNDPAGIPKDPVYPREELLSNIDRLPTLPRLLARHGYLSHQSGKWWEGDYKRGGFTHGMTKGERHGDIGLTIGREGLYPIYQFVDSALIKEKPFFLWYAPFMPHTPHTPPQRLLDKYLDQGLTPSIAKYYAMIEWFDETCGQLVDFLDNRGLRDNTLIYYICDNGWIQKPDRNGFDFGSKQSPMEGGVRTPIMFSWPGQLKPTIREEFISSIDLFPTILQAAGIEMPDSLPGSGLWDELNSGNAVDRNIIFGEGYGHNIMEKDNPEASLAYLWCIEDNWKLILCYDGEIEGWGSYAHVNMQEQPIRLYDLKNDPYETINQAKKYPEKVEILKKQIEEWYPLNNRKILK